MGIGITRSGARKIRNALMHRTIAIEDFEQAVRDAQKKVETADIFLAEALFKHFSKEVIDLAVTMWETGTLSERLVELAILITGEPRTLMLPFHYEEMRLILERTEDGLDVSIGVASGSRESIWRYAGTRAGMLATTLGAHVPVVTIEGTAEE